MLWGTWMYKYLFEVLLLIILSIYLEVELLDHRLALFLIFLKEMSCYFPQQLYHFTFLLTVEGFQFLQFLTKTCWVFLFLIVVVELLSCVQLFWYPMDCSLLGSSVHGISQARILEWVAISFSRGSSWFRDQTHVSCIAGRFFTILYHWGTKPPFFSILFFIVQFSSVAQSCVTPRTAAHLAFMSITSSWSLLKPMSIKSVMPSNHFILCCSLLLLPSIFPTIRVFSNESVLRIRWPKYWSFQHQSFQWIFRTGFL